MPVRLYPEVEAGGFTRFDSTVQFWVRTRALADECDAATIVDLGAGRGRLASHPIPLYRTLVDLRSAGRHVIGLDVDPAVRTNPLIDEARLIVDGRLPMEDGTVDLVVSDWTLEHVANPATFASEIHRVLRPGGWFCARTPNKWGLIGVGARLVPNAFHVRLLRILQPHREEVDVFPTAYSLNTRRDLRLNFPASEWTHAVYGWDPEAAYGGRFVLVQFATRSLSRVTPEGLRAVWLIYLRRQ